MPEANAEEVRRKARERMARNQSIRDGNGGAPLKGHLGRDAKELRRRLKEETERRKRSDELRLWLRGEFSTSQQQVDGLQQQLDRLRQAPAIERFKELWNAANAAEQTEIRTIVGPKT